MDVKFYLRIKIIQITRLQAGKKTVVPKYEKIKVLLLLLLLLTEYNFSHYSADLVTCSNFIVYNLFLCISAYFVIGY